ncbi:hypothetical protein ABZX51_005120 [Aspergillus tubingensis]
MNGREEQASVARGRGLMQLSSAASSPIIPGVGFGSFCFPPQTIPSQCTRIDFFFPQSSSPEPRTSYPFYFIFSFLVFSIPHHSASTAIQFSCRVGIRKSNQKRSLVPSAS